jgi:hypothetical protein
MHGTSQLTLIYLKEHIMKNRLLAATIVTILGAIASTQAAHAQTEAVTGTGTVSGKGTAAGTGTVTGNGAARGEGSVTGTGVALYRNDNGKIKVKKGAGTVDGKGVAIGKGTATGTGKSRGKGTATGTGTAKN